MLKGREGMLKGRGGDVEGRMLKGMGVLMGRGMEKEWSCVGIASSSCVVFVCCGRVVVAWLRSALSLRGFVPRRGCVASFRVVVVVCRRVASSLHVGMSSSCVLAVPSTCLVVSCHCCLDVSEGG